MALTPTPLVVNTQSLVPIEEWPKTAVVLACLESVYRAEFAKVAEDACTALAEANRREFGGKDSDIRKGQGCLAQGKLLWPVIERLGVWIFGRRMLMKGGGEHWYSEGLVMKQPPSTLLPFPFHFLRPSHSITNHSWSRSWFKQWWDR